MTASLDARPALTRLRALVGIVAISFSAVFVRAADVSAGTSAFFRALYAVPALLVVHALLQGGRTHRPARMRWLAFAAGALLALDLNFWHRSIGYVGAGLATVLGNLQVIVVGVVAWLVLGERPTRVALVAVPVALVGVVLTTGVGRGDAYGSAPALGALFGVLTAVAYSAYLLLFRESNRLARAPVSGPLLDATLGAAVAGLVLGVAFDPAFALAPTWPAHGWLVGLALGSHTFGWLLISYALPRLPALETSVLLLLQPCLTMVWGVFLFTESPSTMQWAGVVLVLAAVALASWRRAARREAAPSPSPVE